ncbi:hypothetical protein XENORESO_021746 [Xenotaenia resolanae]|uniref:Uncharacterized protein n=1 Tax=Xenotaenia resolanae TaxID=208358 RepID=A0ABV0WKV3_9TELE
MRWRGPPSSAQSRAAGSPNQEESAQMVCTSGKDPFWKPILGMCFGLDPLPCRSQKMTLTGEIPGFPSWTFSLCDQILDKWKRWMVGSYWSFFPVSLISAWVVEAAATV